MFMTPKVFIVETAENHLDKGLANTKGPSNCSVLYLRPKGSLCSCHHRSLDTTSFGFCNADSVQRASNNRVGQFKPVFQVKGNTFGPIFFSYFIADWLLYNFAAGSFHTTKLYSRLYSIEIEFYSEILKNRSLSHTLGDLGVTYAVRTPSIARWKAHGRLYICHIKHFR